MGVLKEIWTGEVLKQLRREEEGTWLNRIKDNSSIVNNDVIHLVDAGVDPDVLVNNTTYPIKIQETSDKDVTIRLDKFQTKATPITDDELQSASYDKIARVKESHAAAIADSKVARAAHALSAKQNTASTPVVKRGDKTVLESIIEMKKALDKLKVPAQGRILVLCTEHVNMLLAEEKANFKEQYNINRADGTIGRLYGFDIYESTCNPIYTAEGVKKDMSATAQGTDLCSSFAFLDKRVFKATGSLTMYYSKAETDPQYQRNLVNFRHYFICMPKKEDAGVVLIG